jgi:hypothetical protein
MYILQRTKTLLSMIPRKHVIYFKTVRSHLSVSSRSSPDCVHMIQECKTYIITSSLWQYYIIHLSISMQILEFIASNEALKIEVEEMLKHKKKVELEALVLHDMQYFSRTFIPNKIVRRDYI